MEVAHRNANQVTKEVSNAYTKAVKQICSDMDNILENFSHLGGMSKAEAITLLNERISQKRMDDIRSKIANMKDGPIKTQLINKINAQAYKARITRKQALKENIQIECAKIANTELESNHKFFVAQVKDTYYRNMFDYCKEVGTAIDFAKVPTKRVNEILSTNWSGKHYSKRIWDNNQTFADKLEEIMLKGLMTGSDSRRMAKEMAEYAEVGKHISERLLRTETTYVATMADLEAMKERGTKKLQFVATLDSRTSHQCQKADGTLIDVDKAQPGVNVPPLHCYCRSTVIEVIHGLQHDVRAARDENGKPITVPADMTYPEWHKKYVEDTPNGLINEQMQRNVGIDKIQYNNYKDTLGKKNVPATLKEFQNIKYRNEDEYGILKAQVKGMQYYEKAVENEPMITKVLGEISSKEEFEMVGLEYRIKTKDSYLRKIRMDYGAGKKGYEVNDIVRYTYCDKPDSLVDKTITCIECLNDKGYNTIRIKNTWIDSNNPYKGINTIVEAPNGQKFEVQYHTKESFDLKNNELHKLYEEQRLIKDRTSKRYIELDDMMYELSDALHVPDDIERVK